MKFEVYKKGKTIFCKGDRSTTTAVFKLRKGVYILGYIDRLGKRSSHDIRGHEPFGEKDLPDNEYFLN